MRHNLWIGLSYSPPWVLILAFLTRPSFPRYVVTTRASFHRDLFWLGSNSKTKSSTSTFSLVRSHLFSGNWFGAKYLIQHFQNSFTRSWVLLRRSLGLTLSSDSEWGSGRWWPIRISFGVMGGLSQMLLELRYKGRPLMMKVVSDRNVLHCSSVKVRFFSLQEAWRPFLTDLMRVSTTPIWWLASGLFHSHLKSQQKSSKKIKSLYYSPTNKQSVDHASSRNDGKPSEKHQMYMFCH